MITMYHAILFILLILQRVNNSKKAETDTLRILCGWKHKPSRQSRTYKIVQNGSGGGNHPLDISKTATKDEVLEIIAGLFLPEGSCPAQDGLKRVDVTCWVGDFSGNRLGEDFSTMGEYYHKRKTTPVRLYLHTDYMVGLFLQEQTVLSFCTSL